MKRRMLITAFVFGLVIVAVGGWTVDGVRWAATGSRRRRSVRRRRIRYALA